MFPNRDAETETGAETSKAVKRHIQQELLAELLRGGCRPPEPPRVAAR